jgi:hypothetical protein
MTFELKHFRDIHLGDPFFDSLREDYQEFAKWFEEKSGARAYVTTNSDGLIEGFLFLKSETGEVDDVDPPLPAKLRIKVGTFKINAHGTKLGQRFLKKVFDHALDESAQEIYVTIFPKHEGLVNLLSRYGFCKHGTKSTSNGVEDVFVKRLDGSGEDLLERYPVVDAQSGNHFLLALYPVWHSRLLPDSILSNEDHALVQDISSTNSIHKVYLGAMPPMQTFQRGDKLVIYRTGDGQGAARFRAVASSVCVVEEYRHISSFSTENEFMAYCAPFSVFTEGELKDYWQRRPYPHVVRFTYNLALPSRVTRGKLIDEVGLDETQRWGCLPLTVDQFKEILRLGEAHESSIIA